jgi:hypothetical protein
MREFIISLFFKPGILIRIDEAPVFTKMSERPIGDDNISLQDK